MKNVSLLKYLLTSLLFIITIKLSAQTCLIPGDENRCAPPVSFTFISKQDGNWTSGTTWQGGVAPPTENVNNRQIKITHNVAVQNGNIKLDNRTVIYITGGGSLTLRNGNLYLEDGNQSTTEKFLIAEGTLRTSGNVQQSGSATIFCAQNANLEIGDEDARSTPTVFTAGLFNTSNSSTSANFQNTRGYRRLESVCLNVTHDMQNEGGLDELIFVCAEIGDRGTFSGVKPTTSGNSWDGDDSGNFQFQSSTGTSTKIYDSEFYIPNGNVQNNRNLIICNGDFRVTNGSFQNQSSSSITGSDIHIWINNSGSGNINNSGDWLASTITAWRTDNSNRPTGLSELITESAAEDILQFFNDCECGGIILLPVELINFDGKRTESGINLTWKTATELNSSHFEIERSADGRNFEKIGQVKAQGTTTSISDYQFTDLQPSKNDTYYRLHQVDIDGHDAYSPIINISPGLTLNELVVQLVPNPCTDEGCSVLVKGFDETKSIQVELKDLSGRIILSQTLETNQTSFVLLKANIKSGVYILSAKNGNQLAHQKVVIQ